MAISTATMVERIAEQHKALEEANAQLKHTNQGLADSLDEHLTELESTKGELRALQMDTGASFRRWSMVGQSRPMRQVYSLLDRVVETEVPVVLIGESGTGKELAARALHREGARHRRAFVSLNCGAIPEALLESELFGHEAGAFTGATKRRDGVLVRADGGTLFLDEAEHMPQKMQVDLLRVLQEMRVRPLGGTSDRAIDVRFVAATQRPLQRAVQEGVFREDLYYRLAVMEIVLPPLRQRYDDLPELCQHLLRKIRREQGLDKKVLSRQAMRALACHPLPGNVRQLEHLLLSAAVMTSSGVIDLPDLGLESASDVDQPHFPGTESTLSLGGFKNQERDRIIQALHAHGWNKAKAARALGMPRRTLYRRLTEHRITKD